MALQNDLHKYNEHKNVAEAVMTHYQKLEMSLPFDEILLVIDFTQVRVRC